MSFLGFRQVLIWTAWTPGNGFGIHLHCSASVSRSDVHWSIWGAFIANQTCYGKAAAGRITAGRRIFTVCAKCC